MIGFLQTISLFFQSAFVATNILGLPGNILSLVFPLIWWLTGHLTGSEFLIIATLVATAEVLEQIIGFQAGKKAGLNNKSMIFSFIGAIALGIMMAPILLGFGALIGAFAGAFLGTFLYEYMATQNSDLAIQRGLAALKGRFLGTMIKLSLGVASVVISASYLF